MEAAYSVVVDLEVACPRRQPRSADELSIELELEAE